MKKKVVTLWLAIFSIAVFSTEAQTPYKQKIDRAVCGNGELILVSWNACNFGQSKDDNELAEMAKILHTADIIALQEVSATAAGEQAVYRLSCYLSVYSRDWRYVVTQSTHKSKAKECYAFFWRSKYLSLDTVFLLGALADKMAREPALAKFQIVGGDEFTLVSFHLSPEGKNPENEVAAIACLKNIFDSKHLIFVGDFNLSHESLQPFEDSLSLRHRIEGKTSLKSKKDATGYFSKDYDNIFVKNMEICQEAIIDFVPEFQTLDEAKEISDHLPVVIFFSPSLAKR